MKIKKRVYIFVGLLSLLLYTLGVVTGSRVQTYFLSKTLGEIETLNSNLKELQNNLDSWKTQQIFISSLDKEKKCDFLNNLLENSQDKLSYYWSVLPPRLEEFELKGVKSQEYENLKTDYMGVSLDVWGLTLQIEKECNPNLTSILYFYAPSEESIQQGKELDKLKLVAEARNKTITVFTIDFSSTDSFLNMIKSTFNISRAPSLLVKNMVFTGLTSSGNLTQILL